MIFNIHSKQESDFLIRGNKEKVPAMPPISIIKSKKSKVNSDKVDNSHWATYFQCSLLKAARSSKINKIISSWSTHQWSVLWSQWGPSVSTVTHENTCQGSQNCLCDHARHSGRLQEDILPQWSTDTHTDGQTRMDSCYNVIRLYCMWIKENSSCLWRTVQHMAERIRWNTMKPNLLWAIKPFPSSKCEKNNFLPRRIFVSEDEEVRVSVSQPPPPPEPAVLSGHPCLFTVYAPASLSSLRLCA